MADEANIRAAIRGKARVPDPLANSPTGAGGRMIPFKNRQEAGRLLGEACRELDAPSPLVLAIPRGGVVVGAGVARALGAPLDVIVPRKIGAPHNPELAVGAVGPDGEVLVEEDHLRYLGVSREYLAAETARQLGEIARRLRVYRGDRPAAEVRGRSVFVVDDGVATGLTMKVALRSVRSRGPSRLIVAVPVAPPHSWAELLREADQGVCLHQPEPFYAVGQFYIDFEQTSDEEVKALLAAHNSWLEGEK